MDWKRKKRHENCFDENEIEKKNCVVSCEN